MPVCEVCSSHRNYTFDIILRDGGRHTFDTFECAIHSLASLCDHCGCRILGHPFEVTPKTYCCEGCAKASGEVGRENAMD